MIHNRKLHIERLQSLKTPNSLWQPHLASTRAKCLGSIPLGHLQNMSELEEAIVNYVVQPQLADLGCRLLTFNVLIREANYNSM